MISAKSYARAYLAVTESIDPEERLGWLMVFRARPILRRLTRALQSPQAARRLGSEAGIPDPIVHFLAVLAADHQLGQLGSIASQGLRSCAEQGLGTAARLELASELESISIEQLKTRLEALRPKPVVIEAIVTPRLLGGFRLELGDTLIDASLATRLHRLRAHLLVS
ncbi:F0F1 ATP synthase subunit delta [Candidatus Berkelbacteria bacterium]|nr:F0F1 ATP synthase subunit delta [Candidatus Berkelbacteria bacterium]